MTKVGLEAKLRHTGTEMEVRTTSPRTSRMAGLVPPWVLEAAAGAGILGIGGFLRFFRLDVGLIGDEVYSVDVAQHSVPNMLRIIANTDTHPPLSYLVLHYWIEIFGTSEPAVRSLSAIFSLGTVLMVYLIGRLFWGNAVGLLAALLLALSEYNTTFAHEARMYSMLTFFAASSFYFLGRLWLVPSRAAAVLYLLSSISLIYTHSWGVFLVAAQTLVVLVWTLSVRRRPLPTVLAQWVGLQAVLVLTWIPWLVLGFSQQARTTIDQQDTAFGNLAELRPPSIHDIIHAAYLAANTHTLGLLFLAVVGWVAVAQVVQAGSQSSTPGARIALGVRKAAKVAVDSAGLVLLVGWYVVPLATGVALSYLVVPVFQPRYTVAITLPAYLVVALAVSRLRPRIVAAVALAAIVAALSVSVGRYVANISEFERPPIDFVASRAHAEDVVLYDIPDSTFAYYVRRPDLHGAHIRRHLNSLAFIELLKRRGGPDTRLRGFYTGDSLSQDLRTLRAARAWDRVWLLLGPHPGWLPSTVAVRTLAASLGPPQMHARAGVYDVYFFSRS